MFLKKCAFLLVIIFVVTLISGQENPQVKTANQKVDDAFGWKESILGACLIGIAAFVIRQENQHLKERKDWNDTIREQFKDAREIAKENSDASKEVGSLLGEIKTLLNIHNRRV